MRAAIVSLLVAAVVGLGGFTWHLSRELAKARAFAAAQPTPDTPRPLPLPAPDAPPSPARRVALPTRVQPPVLLSAPCDRDRPPALVEVAGEGPPEVLERFMWTTGGVA